MSSITKKGGLNQQRTHGQRQSVFHVPQPSRIKGLMTYENLVYYDVETDTRYIDEAYPDIPDGANAGQIEAILDDYASRNPLNIENLLQICLLVPSNHKRLKQITVARKKENVILNDMSFTKIFIGGLLKEGECIKEHAISVANLFLAVRKVLGKQTIFAGFNNLRFDSGVLGQLITGTEISRSLTHVLSIDGYREIDLMRWSVALGWGSLEKMGNGLTKLDYKNAKKLDGMTSTNQNLLDEYNGRDVEILAHFVHLLNIFGAYHHNMPSFVKNFYASAFLAEGFDQVRSDARWATFEGIGGRSEAYSFELHNSYNIDANSLYPSVQSAFPYPLIHRIEGTNAGRCKLNVLSKASSHFKLLPQRIDELYEKTGDAILSDKKFLNAYEKIFGEVFFWLRVRIYSIDERLNECFPFGYKDENGAVRFTLNTDVVYEIDSYNMAFLAHCSYEIIDAFTTVTEKLIFKDIVDELYKKRRAYQKENNPFEMLCKIILNSGFGIWGSRGDKTARDYSKATFERLKRKQVEVNRALGLKTSRFIGFDKRIQDFADYRISGQRVYVKEEQEQRFTKNSIPAISQTTLSHARAFMYSVMRKIIFNGGKILYTDTDSLFVDKKGLEIVEKSGLMGAKLCQFKIEAKIVEGYAQASKVYCYLDDEGKLTVKAKGVKNPLRKNTNFATSPIDQLKVVQKVVARAGGVTKRRLCPVTRLHLNEYGKKNREWGKFLEEMLTFIARVKNEEIDPDVLADFVLLDE